MGAARFRCPTTHTDISTVGCGNRHWLARHPNSAHVKEQLAGCAGCPVGDANLHGRPMPSLDLITHPKEKRMEEAKQYERVCARDKQTKFTTTAVQQKACGTCELCHAAAAKNGKPSKNGKAAAAGKPRTAPVPSVAARAPAVDIVGDGLAQMLAMAGFKNARLVDTPGGRMLVAMVAA